MTADRALMILAASLMTVAVWQRLRWHTKRTRDVIALPWEKTAGYGVYQATVDVPVVAPV